MPFYPEKINQRFLSLHHAGDLIGANVVQNNASFVCGAALKILLKIEREKIIEANFKAAGCGYLMAAADVLCEKIVGRLLGDFKEIQARNFLQLRASIENELGKFADTRKHCLELAIETFQLIVQDFQSSHNANWNGDDALICVCFGVSEATINQTIEEHNLSEVSEVTERCNAGGGCGSCQPLIQELLDDKRREKEKGFE